MDYVHQPLPSPIRSIRWICVSAALAVSTFLCADEPPENDVSDKREEIHLYMKGRYVYQRHCVECHGTTGRGNGPWAAELEVKPRNFRSGLFKFRTTAYGTLPVETDLRRTIRSGISGTAMPIFSQLHDEEVDALIEAAGGVYEDSRKGMRRYWVPTAARTAARTADRDPGGGPGRDGAGRPRARR